MKKTVMTALFDELKRRDCEVGLHFWGKLDGDISPNIAYPDTSIVTQSMDLMRQTIDIAAHRHFSYVNIHPGAAALSKVDYKKNGLISYHILLIRIVQPRCLSKTPCSYIHMQPANTCF